MTLLSRIPLSLWLAAGLALAVAWGMWQRDRARDAQAALSQAQQGQREASAVLRRERLRNEQLTESIEGLANVLDTKECVGSPSVVHLPDLLRRGRDNP